MRKYRKLTDEEIHEIEVYKCRRKLHHITIPIISRWNGISESFLYSVENHRHRMSNAVKNAYEKVLKVFKHQESFCVHYEKREEKNK